MTSRRMRQLTLWLWLLPTGCVHADTRSDIEALLSQRWYEIEIIVFERLRLLDVNNPEQLSLNAARTWPEELMAIGAEETLDPEADIVTATPMQRFADANLTQADNLPTPPAEGEGDIATVAALTGPNRWCLGYPMLAERDPPHPSLQPRQEPPAPDTAELARRARLPRAEVVVPENLVSKTVVSESEWTNTAILSDENLAEANTESLLTQPPNPLTETPASPVASPLSTPLTADTAIENLPTGNDEPAVPASEPLLSAPDRLGELLIAAPVPLPAHLDFLQRVEAFEQDLYNNSYRWLAATQLDEMVTLINRQRHLRPILHRRWLAPIPDRDQPQPIHIESETDPAAPLTLNGLAKIEGFIEVTVARYLHFAPTLWYHADNLGLAPIALPASSNFAQGVDIPSGSYMQLVESRRMRSGELHYLDHPKFGIVVRIDPVTLPPTLTDAWERLEPSAQQLLQ